MDFFEEGMALGRGNFARLDQRGQKWKHRNIPIFIREQLWIPYYITEVAGEQCLYIIKAPDIRHPKVYFARWLPDA
ncbi:hypothetical protein [Arsenicibacter rosenii]|uniref:Uncharacterized protein n=1 Tax=Arsenicibacter rosenii TaxID=1750698 RepID=A0A1S2V9T6_9BACT|nr:hypothetical protein [Arsenicibacter rosenii]OIN55439.1 hypothetical protein BLX24_30705 [Arsenicibacter rosenii]